MLATEKTTELIKMVITKPILYRDIQQNEVYVEIKRKMKEFDLVSFGFEEFWEFSFPFFLKNLIKYQYDGFTDLISIKFDSIYYIKESNLPALDYRMNFLDFSTRKNYSLLLTLTLDNLYHANKYFKYLIRTNKIPIMIGRKTGTTCEKIYLSLYNNEHLSFMVYKLFSKSMIYSTKYKVSKINSAIFYGRQLLTDERINKIKERPEYSGWVYHV